MASIYRRYKSPFWQCEFRAADGRWLKRSTKLKDKRRALEWCQALQRAQDLIGAGTPPEAQLREIISETMVKVGHGLTTPTVKSWFEAWLDSRKGTAAPATISKYSTAVHAFLKFLGSRANSRLETIVQPDIVAFRNGFVERGMTPPTVNQIVLRIIGSGFTLAFRQGLIRHNPTAGMRPLKDPGRQRKQAFALEDVRKLLTVAEGDWRGAILCGYSSGMRIGDVANLGWEDIDSDQGVIAFVQRKTGQALVIGLHEDFKEWLSSRPRNDGPIFLSLAGVRTGGRGGLSDQFSELMRRAGVESKLIRTKRGKGQTVRALSFHSFRHSAASHIFRSKVIEETQKRVTGHSGEAVRRYTRIDLTAVRAACALIPRI
jgi:integrase